MPMITAILAAAMLLASGCACPPRFGAADRTLVVELLALDLSTCGRCTGTDRNIEAAIAELRPVLAQVGVRLDFRQTVVQTAEQATRLRLRSSPTLRIDGRDVPVELRETPCADCTPACCGPTADAIDCRVWVWQGREYVAAPKALVLDAILRAYPGGADSLERSAEAFELPENLKRYFAAQDARPGTAPADCCPADGGATDPQQRPPPGGGGPACCGRDEAGSSAATPGRCTESCCDRELSP